MGKITLLQPGMPPRDIALDKARIAIGRRFRNEIHIDDPAVSGEHAVIVRLGTDAVVEDLDSTNGTRVNGQPVKKHFLQDGDVIEVASCRLVYHAATAAARPAAGIPSIEVVSGRNAGMLTPLTKAITVVGGIGEHELLIVRRGPDYLLMAAQQGIFAEVNGQTVPCDGWRLDHRDVIQLADAELHFIYPPASAVT